MEFIWCYTFNLIYKDWSEKIPNVHTNQITTRKSWNKSKWIKFCLQYELLWSEFCFISEKDFLVFFFKRLRLNESDRYADEFPYLSPCGRERNFIRCDDKPIVYTHLIESDSGETLLSFGGAGNAMTTEFLPLRICMLPNTGRVYHPAPAKVGGIGLIKSSLAIELSKYFEFENGEDNPPTLFTWKEEKLRLTNDLIDLMDKSPLEIRELLSNKNWTWLCDCTF